MKHSRFFLVLFLTLIAGIFLVSGSLNRQLCCRAAPVVDVQVSDDSLELAVLNVPWSVPKPAVPDSFQKLSLPELSFPELEYSLPELSLPELSSSRVRLLASEVVVTGEYLFHEVSGFLITFGKDTAAALEVKGQALRDCLENKWSEWQSEDT